MGNIRFIAILGNKDFLALKVMKYITNSLICDITENLCERNFLKKNEEQVYMEALIKFFDIAGQSIEERENVTTRKLQDRARKSNTWDAYVKKEDQAERELVDHIQSLESMIKNGTFDIEQKKSYW